MARTNLSALVCALALLALVGGESDVSQPLENESELTEFEAFRVVEYDERGEPRGCRQGKVGMSAATTAAGNLKKRMVVLNFAEATVSLLAELRFGPHKAGGLLIVLPSPEELAAGVGADDTERFHAVEQALLKGKWDVPVYFAFDNAETRKLAAKLASGNGDAPQLVATGAYAAGRKSVQQVANFHGWLAGKGAKGEGIESLPVIAVVASYDSLAVAPDLAVGADANGSGLVAILQLARIFSKLYDNLEQGRYNLMFVLTAAGKLDYAGTRFWLEQTDSRLLDRIEFALCLDSIGNGDAIYVHTSKQPSKDKVPAVAKLFGTLKDAAKQMQPALPLEIVRKKINVSAAVAWEHEQFSRKDILAVTLSGHATHAPALRASILDRRVAPDVLARNIAFVASAIAKVAFDSQLPANMPGPQRKFLDVWVNNTAHEPRMAALPTKGAIDLMAQAEQVLKDTSHEFQKQPFTLGPERSFYAHAYTVRIGVYDTKPLSFDLMMTACTMVYLFAILVALVGRAEAVKVVGELFKGSKRKQR
jgi:hypothetical protein